MNGEDQPLWAGILAATPLIQLLFKQQQQQQQQKQRLMCELVERLLSSSPSWCSVPLYMPETWSIEIAQHLSVDNLTPLTFCRVRLLLQTIRFTL
jgi:hypothetical protein